MKKALILPLLFLCALAASAQIGQLDINGEIMGYNIHGMLSGKLEKNASSNDFASYSQSKVKANEKVIVTCYNKNKPKINARQISATVQFYSDKIVNAQPAYCRAPLEILEEDTQRISFNFTIPENCHQGVIFLTYYTQSNKKLRLEVHFLVDGKVSKSVSTPATNCPICKSPDTGFKFASITGNVKKKCSNDNKIGFSKVSSTSMIYVDDLISTGKKSSVVILDPKGHHKWNIGENTNLLVDNFGGTLKALCLDKGKFWYSFTNLLKGNLVEVKQTKCLTKIRGTVVAFEETGTESQVWLMAGNVEVKSNKTGKKVTLNPGQRSSVGENGSIIVNDFKIAEGAKRFGIPMSEIKNHQSSTSSGTKKSDSKQSTSRKHSATSDEILDVAPTMPEYPGGISALNAFFKKNIKYPDKAKQKGAAGSVILQFVVEKDGSLSNIKVSRKGKDPSLDAEALRVCKLVKGFKPGLNKDKQPVRVRFTYPVQFKLP